MEDPVLQEMYRNQTSFYIRDDEVDTWFLMDNAGPVLGILAIYLYFVLKFGPATMENRKPYDLRAFMLLYNLAMVVFNAYILFKIYSPLRSGKTAMPWKHLCFPVMKRNLHPYTRALYEGGYYYMLSKLIELLDTVFFVMRKKQSQVTVLHVYHHTNMAISTWAYLKYIKGEQGLIVVLLNSLVHVIMYSYYFLSALGPQVQKYLWWKKYLTRIQLAQFCIVIGYMIGLVLFNCKLDKALSCYMAANTGTFLLLFLNFYKHAYKKKGAEVSELKENIEKTR